MHKIKDLYYCGNCEKDVDGEIHPPTIQGVYKPVKVEVGIRIYCAECKLSLDSGVGLIIVRDKILPNKKRTI